MSATVSNHYITANGGAGTLAKASVVVASGEGLVVLVTASDATTPGAPTITGVTWNATSLTEFSNLLTSDDGQGARHRHACFFLPSPTPGTQTVTASFGSSPLVDAMEVFVVAGHDTSTMLRASSHVQAVGGASAATVDVTTVAGDLVLDLLRLRQTGGGGVPNTAGAGQTKLDETTSPVAASWTYQASSETASGTTTTMSWTEISDSAWNTQAIAVIPAGAGGGGRLFRSSPGGNLSGLGSSGPFFQNPLQRVRKFFNGWTPSAAGILVPDRKVIA